MFSTTILTPGIFSRNRISCPATPGAFKKGVLRKSISRRPASRSITTGHFFIFVLERSSRDNRSRGAISIGNVTRGVSRRSSVCKLLNCPISRGNSLIFIMNLPATSCGVSRDFLNETSLGELDPKSLKFSWALSSSPNAQIMKRRQ